MSSRVITGEQAGEANSLRWMQVPSPAGDAHPQSAGAEAHFSSDSPNGRAMRIAMLERRLAEVEAESASRAEHARQQGYQEGEQAGSARGSHAIDSTLQRMAKTIGEIASYKARYRRESEHEMLKLAMAVARKILHRELSMDPAALLGVIKAALELLNRNELLRVRIAPLDAAQLLGKLDAIGLPQKVEVVTDGTLDRGSVIIETQRGMVDASVNTQLLEIERGFADRLLQS